VTGVAPSRLDYGILPPRFSPSSSATGFCRCTLSQTEPRQPFRIIRIVSVASLLLAYDDDCIITVDVPCATTLSSRAVILASHVMILRPRVTTRPSARICPEVDVRGREKFALVSTVVEPTPGGRTEAAAQKQTLSSKVRTQPPWIDPSGF
jgi:hypothetical protein